MSIITILKIRVEKCQKASLLMVSLGSEALPHCSFPSLMLGNKADMSSPGKSSLRWSSFPVPGSVCFLSPVPKWIHMHPPVCQNVQGLKCEFFHLVWNSQSFNLLKVVSNKCSCYTPWPWVWLLSVLDIKTSQTGRSTLPLNIGQRTLAYFVPSFELKSFT